MSLSMNLRSLSRSNHVVARLFHPSITHYSSASSNYLSYDKDPTKMFFNLETQRILKSITRLQVDKVFRKRAVPRNEVEYKFMTIKQLEDEVRKKFNKAQKLLQMPPVVKAIDEKPKTISHDAALSGFSKASLVFTDVTFGLRDADRSVVIRQPDGTLEEAPYDVRKRVCQIYFPMEGRKFREPKMFEAENFKRLLDAGEYEFLLDQVCIQFEPYELRYHQITSQLYQHVNEHQKFDSLRSTRHFGPMSFCLAWHKMIDDLVLDMIRNDYLKNAVELICLMYKLSAIEADTSILKKFEGMNDTERYVRSTIDKLLSKTEISNKMIDKTKEDLEIDELCFAFIQESFVKNHASKKGQFELALQSYKERHNELKNIAHGVI